MQIKNAKVLVTGANRGIGNVFVEALLKNGAARVYAAARRPEALTALVALDPKRVEALPLDVTQPEAIAAAVTRAKDVNLLINNAGVLDFGSLLEISTAAVRRNMDTNYYGMLSMTRAFAPVIEASGGGAVINILTLVALASMPGLAAYNASKAAAWSMTQSLRADLAKRKIQVFGVFPGAVDTDMIRSIDMPKTPASAVVQAVLEGVVAGTEDIFPDPMSKQLYSAWKADHKAVEHQFASM
ncbi:MAG: SDR family oxidoreductase [Gammaproteobacteria bacterium]|nr:SDR family oxidoreductase [Gammaproteobacteria bacterium]